MFGAVQIAAVTAVTADGTIRAQGVGMVPIGPNQGIVIGGAASGLIYVPKVGDLIVTAKGPGGQDVLLGSYLDPATKPTWAPALAPGEVAIGNAAGAYIKLTALGDIVLVPASGRSVLLGAAGAAVARVGDAVSASGSDPQGGTVTVTGTITASSSEVKA